MASQNSQAGQREVIVRSCKYDGTEHRRWTALVTSSDESLLVLTGSFEKEVRHSFLGNIASGTVSVEYYWMDRWYSIFRFIKPTGELRSYYCNVNAPPDFDGRILTFVDLDIDILVNPDFTYSILDEDEFAENVVRLNYSASVQRRVEAAVEELKAMIKNRVFPFSAQD